MIKIKKYRLCFLAIALMAFVVGCSDSDETYMFGAKGPMIQFKTSGTKELIVNEKKTDVSVEIICNTKWKVYSLEEWLHCNIQEGEHNGKIEFTVSQNEGNKRIGHIVVTNTIGETMYDTLTIVQRHNAQFEPTDFVLKIKSAISENLEYNLFEEVKYSIESTGEWIAYSKENWLTVLTKNGVDDKECSFVISSNDDLAKRSGYIYVESKEFGLIKDSLPVSQNGRPIRLMIASPTNKSILLDESESLLSFQVKGDGAWTVESDDNSWLTFDKREFVGDNTVFMRASASTVAERIANITVKSTMDPSKRDQLIVTQQILPAGRMRDSLALIAMYNSMDGAKWNYPWDFTKPLSEANYYGLFFDIIDDELRVIDISLLNQNLAGTIPYEISWLSEVIKIKMQDNKITGSLPASLNKMTKLTMINFARNNLSGELPDLTAITNLSTLDLESNRITGQIPHSYSALKKLTYIKIKFNNLDPDGCIPSHYATWMHSLYFNPQRRVPGDATTNYDIGPCTH